LVNVAEVTVVFGEGDTVGADKEVVVLMDEMEAVLVDEVAVVLTEGVDDLAVVALDKGARTRTGAERGAGLNLDGVDVGVRPLRRQPD
jgi:hypothetical protein